MQTNIHSAQQNKELSDLIAVERYKFIQEKIKFLDNQQQANFTTLLKVIIALSTFVIASLIAGTECKISNETVSFAISSAGVALIITCIYLLGLSVAILFSWIDYRKEEVDLLNKVNCDLNRSDPSIKFRKLVRWNEFHFMVLLVILTIVGIVTFCYPNYLMNILDSVTCPN
nr:hypothetical protein BCU13_22875 [Vibrio lentus]